MCVKRLKTRDAHFVHIPDCAVRDRTYAAKRTMHVGINLTPEATGRGIRILVVNYRDARTGNAFDMFPVVVNLAATEAFKRLRGNRACRCEACDWRHAGHQAVQSWPEEAFA